MAKIRIIRVTNSGDDENVTDRIDFNVPGSKTKVENAFIQRMRSLPTEGIGNNQGVNVPTGDQAALGTIEDILEITGFVSKRNGNNNDGMNAILAKFKVWETEPKQIKNVWELGRMGIIVDDNHNADLVPKRTGTDQIAYLWERIEYETDFQGNREFFKLFFRKNRGDGT